jgi:hypothetical protein
MTLKARKVLAVFLLSMLLLVALVIVLVLDGNAGRVDRIRLQRERERLALVRDAVLAYAADNRRFPEDLQELAPRYMPESMTTFQPDARPEARSPILWDRESGTLAWADPFVVHGLVAHRERFSMTVERDFPPRDPAPPPGDLPSVAESDKRTHTERAGPSTAEVADAPEPLPPRPPAAAREDGNDGALVPGAAPACDTESVVLGPGAVVIEAEHFQFTTYGWEIGEDARASGGRYIHMKEGVGDYESEDKISADPEVRSGDFHNVTRDRRRIEARCYFAAPAEGDYAVLVRTMAGARQCSNITHVSIDGARYEVGRNGTKPFVWLWHRAAEVRLRKGTNTLSFMAHQDDVKVDQVVLAPLDSAPADPGERVFSGGHGEKTSFPHELPPATMSLSVGTLVVAGGRDPEMAAYVHRNVPEKVDARLAFAIELPGRRGLACSRDVRLTEAEELAKVRWRIELPEPLPRREYLVRCRLLVEGREIEERTLVLLRGYEWWVLGPVPFVEITATGKPEGDPRPRTRYRFGGRPFSWRAYAGAFTDHFGLMDFGRMFTDEGRGVENSSLYAYTEVRARRGGEHLLKAQGDDDLVVWVNGSEVVAISEKGPPIRTAREVPVRLEAGRNRVLFRLGQKSGKWQAAIRFRTLDDQIADVEGIPFADQDVDFE